MVNDSKNGADSLAPNEVMNFVFDNNDVRYHCQGQIRLPVSH
jgi:hypothetical protein